MGFYIIVLLILVLSFLFAPTTLIYAKNMAITDAANERSSHIGVVSRGGGLLFIIFFYIGVLLTILGGYLNLSSFVWVLLLGAFIMALVGWLDDFKGLSVAVRFFIQFALVVITVYFLPQTWPFLPVILEKCILILAWVWFINLYNFMDGADGFATQQSIFISVAILLPLGFKALLFVLLIASLLGFLRVNYPKAKIFMGDIGSLFLGYFIGGMLLYYLSRHNISIIDGLIMTSLFGFDASYTLLKRLLQKKKLSQAHREHWYQRLLITGFSHKALFYTAICYNLLMLLVLIIYLYINPLLGVCAMVALWFLYTGFIFKKERAKKL